MRAFPQKRGCLIEDMKSAKICFQGKARKGWDLGNTYAVRVLYKVPFSTKLTTHSMAKKMGKVGGRKEIFVCYMNYNDKVTEGKPNYEQNCKFVCSKLTY